MTKLDLGVKAIILGIGIAAIHAGAHLMGGQSVEVVSVIMLIVAGVAIFTIDMW